MNTVSMVGSVSRRAGGLFESVRRLHQELMAAGSRDPNGTSHVANETDRPIRVSVLGVEDEFTRDDSAAWPPVPVYPLRRVGPRALNYAPAMFRQLSRLDADLLHVHGLWQFSSIAALCWHRRTYRPYIVSTHGMLDGWALRNCRLKKHLAWLAYERAHLQSAACIRALCAAELKSIRALGLSNPVCVIPNGVDLPELDAQLPGTSLQEDPFGTALQQRQILLYLGRIHPKKGLVALLQAWAEATARNPPWLLAIAGWGQNGHEQELKRLAARLNLKWIGPGQQARPQTNVIFAGPQFGAAKQRWLARCRAFILPSLSEGLPMAVLEAWAFAKPVLISQHCNLPEGFACGAATLVEPREKLLATALAELFTTPDFTLERMGQRGRALVSSRFTWPKVAADLKAVYEWLLGSGPEPGCVVKS